MPQFLIDRSNIKNGLAQIAGPDARHIANILRLKRGDWLVVTDGEGSRWRGEIIEASNNKVGIKLLEKLPSNRLAPITLAQALTKHDKFEWIIQKSVELGVTKIIPFSSERTIKKYDQEKLERWRKIAVEAAKQCGTSIKPLIGQKMEFKNLLDEFKNYGSVVLFYEGEKIHPVSGLPPPKENTLIIIGPEGGFSAGEIEIARKAGASIASLGPLILRVETAAIAAVTLTQNKIGYFDKRPV
jgi:16S rRNA (uracil1498-N3)-methyltransferase